MTTAVARGLEVPRKPRASSPVSFLETGEIPVAEIARLAEREGRRPNPIYQVHKWFARRFSCSFRAILVAAQLTPDAEFWEAFYSGVDYRGRTVLDPFVGGGTSVVEASLLGANTLGVDIDPVACAITRFELDAGHTPDLSAQLQRLDKTVGEPLSRYYRTTGPGGEPRDVVHFFWVQVVPCRLCRQDVEAHPHYRLAYEAESDQQWVFCRHCHDVCSCIRTATRFSCRACRRTTVIEQGTVARCVLCCPGCLTEEPLIEVAGRTRRPPTWRVFALESIPAGSRRRRTPMADRIFQKATDCDVAVYRSASRALARRKLEDGEWMGVPDRTVPREGRSDNRLVQYGYKKYQELFNDRQLLHLSLLAEAVRGVRGRARTALSLAFSDHLTTNCMMTYYALGWRRLAPLFSIRAFRHVTRPVELNPWLDGTGRGTFPNAVRQVLRAVESAKRPQVACLEGGFTELKLAKGERTGRIIRGDSRRLKGIADRSVDMILTDPPYFDNIAYSELSDFYLPWLEAFGLATRREKKSVPSNLAARARGEEAFREFRDGLSGCFAQMRRVLKDDGHLAFTYQHRSPRAWAALASALKAGTWLPVQVFPLLGNSTAGPHQHDGTILWDAVMVCRKGRDKSASRELSLDDARLKNANDHAQRWAKRLSRASRVAFREVDRANLLSATLVAASLGMFGPPAEVRRARPLHDVLEESQCLPTN